MQLAIQETFGNTDQDMTPQLTKIRAADVDAVIIWAAGAGQAIAVKNYRQLGITKPLFTSHGCVDPNLLRLAGEAINSIVCASSKIAVAQQLPDSDPQKAGLHAFHRRFPGEIRPRAVHVCGQWGGSAAACWQPPSTSQERMAQKIRDYLESLKSFVGLNYVFSYSPENHLGSRDRALR